MWSAMDAGVVQVTQIVGGIVLVRLLTPHDYGLAAMALIFPSLVLLLSDFAMGAALIQRKMITQADRSTVFWFSTAVGVCLTLGGVAPIWSAGVLLRRTRGATAVRRRVADVRARGPSDHASLPDAARHAVPADTPSRGERGSGEHDRRDHRGVARRRAWALIAGAIAQALTATVLIWIASSWRPSLTFSMRSLRDLGSYGVNLLGSNVVNYLRNNADSLLVWNVSWAPPRLARTAFRSI